LDKAFSSCCSFGIRGRWNNLLDLWPHLEGLDPFFTCQENLYTQNPDSNNHIFGTPQGAKTAMLTLLNY